METVEQKNKTKDKNKLTFGKISNITMWREKQGCYRNTQWILTYVTLEHCLQFSSVINECESLTADMDVLISGPNINIK